MWNCLCSWLEQDEEILYLSGNSQMYLHVKRKHKTEENLIAVTNLLKNNFKQATRTWIRKVMHGNISKCNHQTTFMCHYSGNMSKFMLKPNTHESYKRQES